MKKILIFSTAYYPLIGGAEVAVKEITGRIKGIEFNMITARMDRKLPKFELIGNINVYRIGVGIPMFDKYLLAFFGHKFAQKWHNKMQYNIVWSIMASYGGFAAMFFKRKNPHVPLLLTLQEGDDPDYINKRIGFLKAWFKRIFTSADYIQCISHYLAKWAKSMGAKCPIKVVPNGVNTEKFQNSNLEFQAPIFKNKLKIRNEEKIVITTSRLVKKNNIEDLIKAVKIASGEMEIKLLICGIGHDKEKLKNLTNELKIQDKVLFLGQISHNELPKYLWTSNVFCRPSLSEGLGNSFLEAMAAGLPVIGAPVGGIPDFLEDNKTGWLCKVNNPESIANKILYILDSKNREEVARVVENASKLIKEKYNWDIIVKDMEEIFRKLFNKMEAA